MFRAFSSAAERPSPGRTPTNSSPAYATAHARREDLDETASNIDDRRVPPRDPQPLAVAADVFVLVGTVPLGMAQKVVDHRDQVASRGFRVRHDQPEHGAAHDLVAGVSEELL